jgi:diguanylate cyclase (GGDEF)-like protein
MRLRFRSWSGLDSYRSARTLLTVGIVALLYFLAGKFGLSLALVHASISPVWPATGIALVALLILGYDVWLGVFLGAFLVNVTTAGSVATSLGIATGNTLEALMGAYLVNRFANGSDAFSRTRSILRFTFLAAMLSTGVAATFGVTSLCLGGFASWANYRSMWWTWWQGDAVGALVVAPVLLLWIKDPRPGWNWKQSMEVAALLGLFEMIGITIFGDLPISPVRGLPVEFLCIPVLIWIAVRFGPRESAASVAILSGLAIWGTMHNNGPFIRPSRNESLLLLQAFMGVMSIMTLVLAEEVSARKKFMARLEKMALTDPLTGLANYRRLLDFLEAEIVRSGRTLRSFAILLFDLDGLKQINDARGHNTGSRALQRLANVLRVHSRAVDLAARYGGDEFVIVLPESDLAIAQTVAARIARRLAADPEDPLISASMGSAIFPEDCQSISELLEAADRALYAAKRARKSASMAEPAETPAAPKYGEPAPSQEASTKSKRAATATKDPSSTGSLF